MIKQLTIQNLAIIEHSVIEFSNGFTVLTGETGAGKSIIGNAIALLLGSFGHEEHIKSDQDEAIVEGLFTVNVNLLPTHLQDLCDQTADIIIWRRLSRKKNNLIRLNNQTITLKTLKELKPFLIEMMGQHEHTRLTDPMFQRHIIDNASQHITKLQTEYIQAYKHYNSLNHRLQSLSTDKNSIDQKIDFLTFQLTDIEQCHFQLDEEDELIQKKKTYKEKETHLHLYSNLNNALTNAYNGLSEANKLLINTSLIEMKQTIEEEQFRIDDLLSTIIQKQRDFEAMDDSIDDIEERLDQMFRVKTKFHVQSINDLLEKAAQIKQERDDLLAYQHDDEELKKQLQLAKETCITIGTTLYQARLEQAKLISHSVSTVLHELHFQQAEFYIEVTLHTDQLTETGIDQIQFLISTNAGEPLKPIEKIASGGELSRVMLALRTAYSKDTETETLFLDEVDTGIGGHTATTIGKFIKTLAHRYQVICITHLAQIAQFADHHLLISKTMSNNKTESTVTYLSQKERENEFHRMVGGLQQRSI